MIVSSVPASAADERLQIHLATCRARRQGLVCSTCAELAERAARAVAPLAEVA